MSPAPTQWSLAVLLLGIPCKVALTVILTNRLALYFWHRIICGADCELASCEALPHWRELVVHLYFSNFITIDFTVRGLLSGIS
jgi:hypothetical protein